ncbi:hypothetical protein L873DRAFT_1674866, partial [Choiromyces venosus 120613-1]
ILLLDGHITYYKDDLIVLKYHENYIVPFEFPSHLIHVLQLLDISIIQPWKHYYNKVIHHALYLLVIEYTISSFF